MSHAHAIAIIGGSLAGLAAARVLHAAGHRVTVFERAGADFATRGGGLGVDLALATAVGGNPPPPHLRLPCRLLWRAGERWSEPAAEDVTAYGALWAWLASGLPPEGLRHGAEVLEVRDGADGVTLRLADGGVGEYTLALCADGGRGAGRGWVEATPRPPTYAGYVLWRGLCPRAALAGPLAALAGLSINSLPDQHFVAYPIPTYAGDTAFDAQLINWGWYRPTPAAAARVLLQGPSRVLVPHAFAEGPPPEAWRSELRAALARWPLEVRELVEKTLTIGRVVPHPVHEVEPGRLARGRIALVGDVAHQASPITGAGARMAMSDALTLAAALGADVDVTRALERYARQRELEAAAVVASGQQAGRRFARFD